MMQMMQDGELKDSDTKKSNMLLLRQKIEGWENFINEQVSGVFPYKYSGTVLSGWVDVTSIENNNLYGHHAADYFRATQEVDILFQLKPGTTEQEKWNNCTQTEKEAISERQLVSLSLRLEVFTSDQDKQNYISFAEFSMGSRQDRIDAAKVAMGYQMNSEDGQELFSVLAEKITRYITSNDPDMNNWMQSLPPYTSTGFASQLYWTQQLQDTYSQIVLNGLY